MAMAKYHMNKKEREIEDRKAVLEILRGGRYVSIAMCRDNEPYIVTLSYGFDGNKNALYFHCSLKGLKLDFVNYNPRVCATVIEDKGYRMGECDQAYRSVIFWGKMHQVEDLQEKKHGMEILLNHLEDDPDQIRKRILKSDEAYGEVGMLRLDIMEISGKQRE
jgi:nitroimidazol reductase NimA-like FMN-containing flavoprotein (pyridoxamine 5'-phosphate oxidase superfamily)